MGFKDPEKRKEARRRLRHSKQEYSKQYKMTHPCQRCGNNDWRVLDFHHRDPGDKRFAVGKSVGNTLAAFRHEIEKCDVLCANCHRIIEYEMRLSKGIDDAEQ